LIKEAPQLVLVAFVIFSRVGACLMLMPGLSSNRIPVQVRLYVAIAFALGLTPLLQDVVQPGLSGDTPVGHIRMILSESLTGALIGLLGRAFFIALETIGMAIAMAVGLSSNLGAPVNEDEPLPAITTLLTLAATLLLFLTDQHLEIFRAIATSYTTIPVQGGFSSQFAVSQLASKVGLAFVLALRLGSPFLILSIVLNFAAGLVSRLVPTVQIFFLASPFLLLLGLLLLYVTVRPFLQLFMDSFGHFLVSG
jgi:flagellar biosynthesis protein FliR